MMDIINKEPYNLFFIWSFTDMFNKHENIQELIDYFMKIKYEDLNSISVFLGPTKYEPNIYNKNYISVKDWDNKLDDRNTFGLLAYGRQKFTANKFYEFLMNEY